MSKAIYVGVGNVAHKVKKVYIGAGNVAHKVKKAYIGVGGVARPFFSDGQVIRYGTLTGLSKARWDVRGVSFGGIAIFAGGVDASYIYANVDSYNSSLTKSTPTSLSQSKSSWSGGTNVGDLFAVFAGGHTTGGAITNTVEYYNTSLVKAAATNLYTNITSMFSVPMAGPYALFGGGNDASYNAVLKVHCYNSSMVLSYLSDITSGTSTGVGATNGRHAIIPSYNKFDSYDSNLVKLTQSNTTWSPSGCRAMGRLGTRAIFAGSSSAPSLVYTVDQNLVMTQPTTLNVSRSNVAGTALNGFFVVGGGTADVDVFAEDLTRTNPAGFTQARSQLGGATAGNYAIFAGGYNSSAKTDVDAYVLA